MEGAVEKVFHYHELHSRVPLLSAMKCSQLVIALLELETIKCNIMHESGGDKRRGRSINVAGRKKKVLKRNKLFNEQEEEKKCFPSWLGKAKEFSFHTSQHS